MSISTNIWNTSWSLRKLYGCKITLVVKENLSIVTKMTFREENVRRRFSVFILNSVFNIS